MEHDSENDKEGKTVRTQLIHCSLCCTSGRGELPHRDNSSEAKEHVEIEIRGVNLLKSQYLGSVWAVCRWRGCLCGEPR